MNRIHGHKKAMGDYNAIIERGNYGIILLDVNTGCIWCDEHVDTHSYVDYKSKTIIGLSNILKSENEKINMYNLKKYAEKIMEV